jgi:predicted nucleic acid-binding protein
VTTYIDSSALVAVYVPERFSRAAREALRSAPQVPFTQLHELEVPNAFELLVGRRLIKRAECRAIQEQLHGDIESQRLMSLSMDLEGVFVKACELSRTYTATLLTRSLDLLHVAAAHIAMCTTFVSADDRQLGVAKATGLRVVDIKRRVQHQKS